MGKALSGVTVIDLTDSVAGSYCTMLMGDLGAEIIKVEQIGDGDPMRRNSPEVNGARPVFAAYNRNKKSMALDLKKQQAIELIKRLLEKADVLIDNAPYGMMEKLGLDYHSLKKNFPRLICASITGYGSDGPYRDRPVFEGTLQAETGMTYSLILDRKGSPCLVGGNMAQSISANSALVALLGALHQQTVSGLGQKVEINMYSTMLYMYNCFISDYVLNGTMHPKVDGFNAPTSFVRSSDGWIRVSGGTKVAWQRIRDLINDPLLNEPRFDDAGVRNEHYTLLTQHVENWTKQYTSEEAIRIFTEHSIPCGAVKSVADLKKDPHLLERKQIVMIDVPELGPIPFFAMPYRLQDSPADYVPAPQLGEHSCKILSEYLKMDEATIDALKTAGIVG